MRRLRWYAIALLLFIVVYAGMIWLADHMATQP